MLVGGVLVLTIRGVYPAIALIHVWFTVVKVSCPEPIPVPLLRAVLTSQVLLVIAVLLQWDEGDGRGWLTITDLLGGMTL